GSKLLHSTSSQGLVLAALTEQRDQKWDRMDMNFCRDISHSVYLILHLNPHAATALEHMPERKYPYNTLLRSEKAITSPLLHASVWGLNHARWNRRRYSN
ncbi:unnamed protein product, partial [Amoebophrya sp. A25]